MSLFEAKNLVAGYPHGFQSRPVMLKLAEGDRIGITGPNGSGKSVFVQTILGLIRPLSGKLSWQNGYKIGFVPQFHEVNRIMPITVGEVLSAACHDPTQDLTPKIDMWQIRKLLSRSFHELSGGQKQKVLITRMLLLQADILVMDEPTNHMDAKSRGIFWQWLQEHPAKAMIMVEHDASHLEGFISRSLDFGDN